MTCRVSGQLYVLVESHQEFTLGRWQRSRDFYRMYGVSLLEKLKRGEAVDTSAARRAIREELGIAEPSIEFWGRQKTLTVGPTPCQTYPGLLSQFELTVFEWEMPLFYYQPSGYVEVQEEKSTYFVWQIL